MGEFDSPRADLSTPLQHFPAIEDTICQGTVRECARNLESGQEAFQNAFVSYCPRNQGVPYLVTL